MFFVLEVQVALADGPTKIGVFEVAEVVDALVYAEVLVQRMWRCHLVESVHDYDGGGDGYVAVAAGEDYVEDDGWLNAVAGD